MLAIRLQRTGRKGYAQYRVIVQDSHRSPTSGRVIAYLGSYDPHAKTVSLKKDQAQKFLDNGAQPSERVAGLLKSEGVKLPKWVTFSEPKERSTRNAEKLRKNQPEKPEVKEEAPAESTDDKPVEAEAVAEEPSKDEAAAEDKVEETPEEKSEEAPAEEPTTEPEESEEKPQEDKKATPAEK